MSKINLKSGSTSDSAKKKKRSSNTSVTLGVIFLLLAFGVYGALMMVNKSKENKKEKVEQETLLIKEQMDSEEYQKMYDFESRLSELKSIVGGKTLQENLLHILSQHTLESTQYQTLSVESLNDELTISLDIRTTSLEELSKQVDAFNKIEGISKLLVASASPYAEDNKAGIEATIELTMQDQRIH